jgi:hypothetical protein
MKMNTFQMMKKQMKKITREIKAVKDAIKLSARQYIPHEMTSSARQIIRTLPARYKQDNVAIEKLTLLNEISEKQKNEIKNTPTAELKSSTPTISFANIVLRESTSLNKSVIYDSECSDPLTYDKNRFLREIKPASD